jgi:hypothetical protein
MEGAEETKLAPELYRYPRPAEITDTKALDIETYIMNNLENPQWKICFQRPFITLESIRKSKFSSDVPMFKITMDFGTRVDADFILNMFENFNWRHQWDEHVGRMEHIETQDHTYLMHYQHFLFNRPLADRDVVVKCCFRQLENELRAVFYSTSHPSFPETREIERTKIHFGVYRVIEGENTRMQIIQQVDMHFSLLRIQQLVPLFLIDFVGRYRDEVLKRYPKTLAYSVSSCSFCLFFLASSRAWKAALWRQPLPFFTAGNLVVARSRK